MTNALCAIDNARINAYKRTNNLPITFELILKEYTLLQPDKERDRNDSIKSVMKQLIKNKFFSA
ncbi:hypothetical protein [Runella zeae]|uniref:hypothetical protein n=1 Tax=Runella zeae TaxID=94255 RepID=UPI00040D1073|nr:hypothetical protein [Runella zeae]